MGCIKALYQTSKRATYRPFRRPHKHWILAAHVYPQAPADPNLSIVDIRTKCPDKEATCPLDRVYRQFKESIDPSNCEWMTSLTSPPV
jgi:hypothetical protein